MVEVLQDIMQEIEDVVDKVKDEELQAVGRYALPYQELI